jgi:hypothetical protein
VYFVQDGVYGRYYRDKKVVGVFVRFSCAASSIIQNIVSNTIKHSERGLFLGFSRKEEDKLF